MGLDSDTTGTTGSEVPEHSHKKVSTRYFLLETFTSAKRWYNYLHLQIVFPHAHKQQNKPAGNDMDVYDT